MKPPLRVTPQVRVTTPDGLLTRDGFNLFSEIIDRLASLSFFPGYSDVDIADAESAVNTSGKAAGVTVLDTVNHRLMTARGPLAADPWDYAGGSVTPT